MIWMWHAVWKVLQPQPRHRRMICTHTSPRILVNSPKSGETSVLYLWVNGHMPIYNIWRCSSTSYICIAWMWHAVWKVLQCPPLWGGILFTLTSSTRISTNSPTSGGLFVVVMLWVCIHMIILHWRMCSNTLSLYAMDVVCSLKGFTASTIA